MPKHTTPHAAFQNASPQEHSDRSNACSSGIQGVPVESLQPSLVLETIEGLSSCLEYFRLYQEQAPKGFVSLDRDGRIQEVNQAWLETTGFSRGSVLLQPVHHFLTRESWEALEHHLKDPSLDKGFQEELELCTPAGSRLLMLVHGKVTGGHTNGRKAHCLFQDITQARRHQERIQTLEHERTMFMDNMNEAVIFYDREMTVRSANRAACERFKKTLHELQGKTCTDLFCVDTSHCERCAARRSMDSGDGREETVRDSLGRWWLMRFFPARDHQGGIMGVVQLALDITGAKQAEEALRTSERQYRTIFDHAGDAIFVHDLNGRFLDVNRVACERLGYSRSELLEMTPRNIDSQYQSQAVSERVRTIREQGELFFETEHVARDGRRIPTAINARLIKYRGVSAVLSIARDLTEVQEAKKRKQALEDQLRQSQKMEALGKMAGGVAHDFNNLLQAALGYVELLTLQKDPEDPEREILEKITSSLDRGTELVRRLLTFGRKGEVMFRPVRLERVMEDARQLLERTLPKSVSVAIKGAEGLSQVLGDACQLEQVLMNLVHNASDAMDEKGEVTVGLQTLTLGMECEARYLDLQPGTYVMLTISDTGPGIGAEIRSRIFEPFFTTKSAGKGTGLGLSIVYGIVRNHGGHITCYSEPGKGTTFHIYLPTLENIPEQKQEETNSPQLGKGTGMVLLVDDMHSILDVAGTMLESAGLEVIKASSGEEALEKLSDRANAIDLVILDLGMPGLGGEGCLKEMRRRNMTTPVILTSGYAGSPMAKDPGKFGAAAFLTKPYSREKLVISALKVMTKAVTEQDTIKS